MKVLSSAIVGALLSAHLLANAANAVLHRHFDENTSWTPVEETTATAVAEAVVGGKTRNLQYSIKIVGGVPATKGEFKVRSSVVFN
jgi:hypothetical protein